MSINDKGAVAQLGERLTGSQEVVGSICFKNLRFILYKPLNLCSALKSLIYQKTAHFRQLLLLKRYLFGMVPPTSLFQPKNST